MILGIGIDVVNIKRVSDLLQKFDQKFEDKIFTKKEKECAAELKNIDKKIAFYAKRFAAKEAFSKACGLGIGRGIDFLDIEISNNEIGKPSINILNDKIEFLKLHFAVAKIEIHLSLTDEEALAQAIVILEKTN